MADYSKVKPGDEVDLTAEFINDTITVIEDFKRNNPTPRPNPAKLRGTDVILVQNNTGVDIDQWQCVGLNAPVTLPADNEAEFDKRIAMTVATPTDGHAGRWCVAWEPIANGKFGLACLSGTTVALVNLATVADTYVEVSSGLYVLAGTSSGSGQILWVAGGVGTASATGQQRAVIRFGSAAGALPEGEFPLMVYTSRQNGAEFDFVRAHPLIGGTVY